MKKVLLNTLAITALFGLMSNACDDLVEDIKINVPLELEKEITLDIPAGDTTYYRTSDIDLNEELADIEVESVEITKVSYEIILDADSEAAEAYGGIGVLDRRNARSFTIEESFSVVNTSETTIEVPTQTIDYIEQAVKGKGFLTLDYGFEKSGGAIKGKLILRIEGKAEGVEL